MKLNKAYFLENFAPAFGAMTVFIFGAFLVYKGWHEGPDAAARLAGLEPAAGVELIREGGKIYLPIDINNIPVWSGAE